MRRYCLILCLIILFTLPLGSSFEYESTKQTKCIEGLKSCEEGHTELWECLPDGSYKKTECICEIIDSSPKCKDNLNLENNSNYLQILLGVGIAILLVIIISYKLKK